MQPTTTNRFSRLPYQIFMGLGVIATFGMAFVQKNGGPLFALGLAIFVVEVIFGYIRAKRRSEVELLPYLKKNIAILFLVVCMLTVSIAVLLTS